MVVARREGTKVTTGEVRLSYANLFEARAAQEGQDPKYSCVIVIPKSDKKTLSALREAAKEAAEIGKVSKFGGKIPPALVANPTPTLHDGDVEADLERNPEYEGCYYMSVSGKTQPGLIDREKMPITSPQELYSGCYVRVQLGAGAYNVQNKGVSFFLNHVQKLRDGEMLGGQTKVEDAFDDLDDEDDADDDLI